MQSVGSAGSFARLGISPPISTTFYDVQAALPDWAVHPPIRYIFTALPDSANLTMFNHVRLDK